MPRTKTPNPRPRETDGMPLDGEVLTLAQAAAYLQVSEADVLQAIQDQGLPARRIGETWRFSRLGLLRWLNAGQPAAQAGKDALLALAGKYRDDPDLQRICDEARCPG